jgi:hypothetical protein
MTANTTPHVETVGLTYDEVGVYFTGRCGNTSAFVGITPTHTTVCCLNASARRLGAGRTFATLQEARASYKLPAVLAIIDAANSHDR